MRDLLMKLLLGHIHTWEIIERHNYTFEGLSSTKYGTRYHLQCKHCGKVKKKDLV